MDTRSALCAGPVGGVAITILASMPNLDLVNGLPHAGFWGGDLLPVWLDKRQTSSVALAEEVGLGGLAESIAGAIGFWLSLKGLTEAQAMMESITQHHPADDGIDPGSRAAYAWWGRSPSTCWARPATTSLGRSAG